jgi:hypothetical protein
LPEAQPANAELAQIAARPSAQPAAVMPARGKDPSVLANASLTVFCTFASTDRAQFVRFFRLLLV